MTKKLLAVLIVLILLFINNHAAASKPEIFIKESSYELNDYVTLSIILPSDDDEIICWEVKKPNKGWKKIKNSKSNDLVVLFSKKTMNNKYRVKYYQKREVNEEN